MVQNGPYKCKCGMPRLHVKSVITYQIIQKYPTSMISLYTHINKYCFILITMYSIIISNTVNLWREYDGLVNFTSLTKTKLKKALIIA